MDNFEENESAPQNMPSAEENHPSEAARNAEPPQEAGNREAQGNLERERPQPEQEFKEDAPVRQLDPEEIIRGVDELERLREEIRRVRNKFVMMHWKQRHSRSRPYPVCFRP